MSVERFKPLATGNLLVMRNGKLLLQQRKNKPIYDGYWATIGGHVEEGELPLSCTLREAFEELGIEASPASARFMGVLYAIIPGATYAHIFFVIDNYTGPVVNKEPEKCAGFEWFDLDALPEKLFPGTLPVIEMLKSGEHYREYVMYS
ncbi:MAG: NUDIX domain-containing protein [Alphaproteobacteria bacterium]|nr:NUDIX domain-containing protein [Alphaproteobacteria bacterium]